MFVIDILRNSCYLLEFTARLVLVNIPSYLLAKSPEVDRISSIAMAYLTFQVVGLCWAFLVNAAFSLATRVTAFLPPLNLTNDLNLSSSTLDVSPSLLSNPHTSVQLIAIFYVSYASIRVVVSFAQSVFHIALESIKDFPDVGRVLSKGGVFTLHLTPIVFIPALFLELGLIFADPFCAEVVEGISKSNAIQQGICNHTGLFYLTSAYSEVRRLIFYAVIAMVLQIWQAHLHQFPRWDLTFKELSPTIRLLFQLAVLLLTIFTLIAIGLVLILRAEMNSLEAVVCGVLLGWTIWLFAFTPFLVATHGEVWASRVTSQSIQHLGAYLRISHMLIFVIIFCCVYFTTGFVQAQLDIIFATILIPAFYSGFFILASACIRAGPILLLRGVPIAIVVSLVVTLLLAKSGGKGGILLVFLHILGKIIHFFGEEIDDATEEEGGGGGGWMEDKENDHTQGKDNTQHLRYLEDKGLTDSRKNVSFQTVPVFNTNPECLDSDFIDGPDFIDGELDGHVARSSSSIHPLQPSSSNLTDLSPIAESKAASKDEILNQTQVLLDKDNGNNNVNIPPIPVEKVDKQTGSKTVTSYGSNSGIGSNDYHSRASSDALQLLSERGQAGSSFVSLGLPKRIGAHWLVKMSQRNMSYFGHIMRSITVSDSFITAILRLFTILGAIFTLILCTLSVASVAQQNLQFFPRSFDFEVNADGSVLFDHKIANVTLYPKDHHKVIIESPILPSAFSINRRPFKKTHMEEDNINISNKDNVCAPRKKPHYAACSWHWHSLSLFDFALFSEVAYFDERQGNQVQDLVSTLMPDAGFKVHLDSRDKDLSLESQGGRPMYLELTSETLGVTVLAIRGTDIGRVHDFMEDIKMFAEPVLFSMLSGVFPTIRLWSQDTTSRVIEFLFEFNSFFGLQGEADYYRPLTQRIFEILESSNNSVMITGHSLGGGLARIVGTLTEVPSVSFSPPGLALSYRKYSAIRPDGSVLSITSKGAMHHESVAVITEFDWITQVDHQVGLVQKILCDKDEMAELNSCHLLEGTICHLLEHCGDPQQRFSKCDYDVDIGAVAPSVISFAWDHRWVLSPIVLLLTLMVALAIVPELL